MVSAEDEGNRSTSGCTNGLGGFVGTCSTLFWQVKYLGTLKCCYSTMKVLFPYLGRFSKF